MAVSVSSIMLFLLVSQPNEIIPLDENQYLNLQNDTYYTSPTVMNITEGKKINFGNAIFTYDGSTLGTIKQCAANKVNSTYKDYVVSEMAHFTIVLNGKTHTVDTCWLPPWTGQLPIAQFPPPHLHTHGINTIGIAGYCVPVILWADKERDAGISVGIGKTTWMLENGTILHTITCNDNGSIHFLIKKSA